jgi:transcriptional regulator
MYIRPSHRPRSDDDVLEVIRANMFATLVTSSADGIVASHLPFVFEDGTLYAHMARANPQSAMLTGEVLVIFQGPHAYISPSWYEDRDTAPTWDYVAVHCYGPIRIHDAAEARRNIERLIARVETSWSLQELRDEDDVRQMLANIVSFEIPVARFEGKFKLNQGDQPERIRAAIAQLERDGHSELAAYMRRYNP